MHKIFMIGLISISALAHASVDMDAPLEQFIHQSDISTFNYYIEDQFPGRGLNSRQPLRWFVSNEFYTQFARRPIDRYGKSNFWRERFNWEEVLIQTLAKLHLTLDMTEQEIADARAGNQSVLFKPLNDVKVVSKEGRKLNTRHLRSRGIFLIKDFLRAYGEEMTLSEGERFILNYKREDKTVLEIKAAVDQVIASEMPGYQYQNLLKADESVIKAWLLATRNNNPADASIAEACNVLLNHIDSKASSEQ